MVTRPALARSLAALAAAAALVPNAAFAESLPTREPQPVVQIALLLDTSGSMDGLIAQAKTQLWKVVSEFGRAKRNGRTPRLEVALYEYGNDGLPARDGFIRQVVPLTTDLDRISEHLFSLRTNGGSEYCGQAISVATEQLQWSRDPAALKMVFIAGNEPFTQGPVDWRAAVKSAIGRGIVVNTIHCGTEAAGVSGQWKAAALAADGTFGVIDHNAAVATITAPQDVEIARLGAELNDTYVAYGKKGGASKERQKAQDANAGSAGAGAGVGRALAKASSHYRNEDWDLVDAARTGAVAPAAVAPEALPAEMKAMSGEEKTRYVAEKSKRRDELRTRIQKLETERRAFVVKKEKETAGGPKTLDQALLESVHAAAAEKAYTFE